jgi:hypothetical protein
MKITGVCKVTIKAREMLTSNPDVSIHDQIVIIQKQL